MTFEAYAGVQTIWRKLDLMQSQEHLETMFKINGASQAELVIFAGAQGMYGSVYWNYIRPSAKIVQINPGKTQFDSCATLNIREQADVVFSLLK